MLNAVLGSTTRVAFMILKLPEINIKTVELGYKIIFIEENISEREEGAGYDHLTPPSIYAILI